MTHLTRISTNKKTGPIPVSTSSKSNCPPSCPFRGNGCYAESGPINIHWTKVTKGERGLSFDDFCDEISRLPRGQIWRHNQAGDLEGENDLIDFPKLKQLVAANKGRRGFTYTHYPVDGSSIHNRKCIKYANDNGFTVNISANSEAHAIKLRDLNIGPVVCVVPENFETNKDVVVCPAVHGEDVSCATCQLCQKDHKKIIGFPAHGSRKKVAEKVVAGS